MLTQVCNQARVIHSATGTSWFKVKSKDLNGQFPANVEVVAQHDLKVEITDLVGGPVAMVTMDAQGKRLELRKSGEGVKVFNHEWNGIPLWWIHSLMLGSFPCPKAAKVPTRWVDDSTLETQEGSWTYRYTLIQNSGKYWPTALEATRPGGQSVVFKFESPDSQFGIPMKWEAISSIGEVKIRWRDRENKVTSK